IEAGREAASRAPLLTDGNAGIEAPFERSEELDGVTVVGLDEDVVVNLVERVQHEADEVRIEYSLSVLHRRACCNRMSTAARQPHDDLLERRSPFEKIVDPEYALARLLIGHVASAEPPPEQHRLAPAGAQDVRQCAGLGDGVDVLVLAGDHDPASAICCGQ